MSRLSALLNIIIYFVISIIFSFAALIAQQQQLFDNAYIWTIVIGNFVIIGSLTLLNLGYIKAQIKTYNKEMFRYAIVTYLSYWVVMIVFTTVIAAVGYEIPESTNQEVVTGLLINGSTLGMVIMTAIQAPIMEELVFRSSIVHLVSGRDPYNNRPLYYLGLFLSLAVFVGIHLTTELAGGTPFLQVLLIGFPYIVLTIGLLFVYNKFKANVLASYIMHAIVNTIASITLIIYALTI